MDDKWNAFMNDHLNIQQTESGQLKGLSFGVKDVFEIKDYRNSAGNPDWLQSHQASKQYAPVINQLLEQGACLKGTTHTDELMYSLNGENFHYGTPVNPRASDRIPGGSSSGSAVAVSAGIVDFALGTDTGGSIRVPSSYCGIYGFRPTHGLVDSKGVIPLAKSFDTVGWMTRDPNVLLAVGEVLISEGTNDMEEFSSLFFVKEAWSYVDKLTKSRYLQNIEVLKENYNTQYVNVTKDGLVKWAELFRNTQGIEIWNEHGEWINRVKPAFGPGIAERFQWASTLNKEYLSEYEEEREVIKGQLTALLKSNGLLVIPTTPGEAPLLNLTVEEMEQYRSKTMQLTCIAGLCGFPQVTIPLMKENGIPLGLSFIANHYSDLKLLRWVQQLTNLYRGVF
ncbi:amidase [Robertmurraya korlensis]|uniref:amidase n=1 Tax=Robertmurraya korlensis TaxID=519977 RepID=UPI00203F3268|nr:amidase [Robertmurraya korlensis]MCM3599856.1 amidase [Robertmurraya korlensis]